MMPSARSYKPYPADSGILLPQMSAVIRPYIAGIAAVMVCSHDFQNSDIAVTVSVRDFGEITVGIMAKIPDMSKSDPVTVGMNDVGHIIFRVGAKGTGTQAQTVVWIIYHM